MGALLSSSPSARSYDEARESSRPGERGDPGARRRRPGESGEMVAFALPRGGVVDSIHSSAERIETSSSVKSGERLLARAPTPYRDGVFGSSERLEALCHPEAPVGSEEASSSTAYAAMFGSSASASGASSSRMLRHDASRDASDAVVPLRTAIGSAVRES